MSIRQATVEDASSIKNLVSSLSHFYLEDENAVLPEWFSTTLSIAEFERRLSNKDFNNFVYSLDDVIIGYISLKDKSHLYHLFVAEHHQGEGIARQLWDYATSDTGVRVYTVRSSMFAIPVYQSFGFKASEVASSKDGIAFQAMTLVR